MIKVDSRKNGEILGSYLVEQVYRNDDGRKMAQVKCCKCGKHEYITLNSVATKVCKCQKEIGKYNDKIIKGFRILDGYCKTSKSGKSIAIVYKVQCVNCGRESEKFRNCLMNGKVDCRCECKKKIRENEHRLYAIWCNMKSRCNNKTATNYHLYGGRGITICDEWMDDFTKFRDWALENNYSDDLSIDRIDVNGNYEPSNCRWATRIEQANNTRANHLITAANKTMTIAQWSAETGIPERTIWARLHNGWSEYKTLNTPVGASHTNNKLSKPVNQYTLDGVFLMRYPSAAEASRQKNIDRASITAVCRGRQKTAYGYLWKYANEEE